MEVPGGGHHQLRPGHLGQLLVVDEPLEGDLGWGGLGLAVECDLLALSDLLAV